MAPDFDGPGRIEAVDMSAGGFEDGSAVRRMLLIPGLLSPEEAQAIINVSAKEEDLSDSHASEFVGGNGEATARPGSSNSFRISDSKFVNRGLEWENPVLARVLGRIHSLANVPIAHGEDLQVTEYRSARRARYVTHLDSGLGMARSATVLMYLRTLRPGDGGGTVFQETRLSERGAASLEAARRRALALAGEESDEAFLRGRAGVLRASADAARNSTAPGGAKEVRELREACASDSAAAWARRAEGEADDGVGMSGTGPGRRLLVRPVTGMAVVWWNFDQQGRLDGRTLHGACELEPDGVTGGPRVRKVVAQRWMTWHAQQQRSPAGSRDERSPNVLHETLLECVTPASLRRAGVRVPKAPRADLAELAWMLPSNWTSHQFEA